MATILKHAARPRAMRRTERHNADMRAWMRLLIWATRHCAR
jgi:hypothetical protein